MSATPAITYAAEISVIVSQRSENQPRMSQPSRSAAAPITTIRTAQINSRRRLTCPRGAGGAAACVCETVIVGPFGPRPSGAVPRALGAGRVSGDHETVRVITVLSSGGLAIM